MFLTIGLFVASTAIIAHTMYEDYKWKKQCSEIHNMIERNNRMLANKYGSIIKIKED